MFCSRYLASKVKQCKETRNEHFEEVFGTAEVPFRDVPHIQVRLEDAVPEAFMMVLNYIYTDKIDPTKVSIAAVALLWFFKTLATALLSPAYSGFQIQSYGCI